MNPWRYRSRSAACLASLMLGCLRFDYETMEPGVGAPGVHTRDANAVEVTPRSELSADQSLVVWSRPSTLKRFWPGSGDRTTHQVDAGTGAPTDAATGATAGLSADASSSDASAVSGDAGAVASDAGAPAPCGSVSDPTRLWSFDADLEGWELSGTGGGTLAWSASEGLPGMGALEFQASSSAPSQVRRASPFLDLGGRLLSANVMLASGSGVRAKLFVHSGDPLNWADGGSVALRRGEWQCITLNVDHPVSPGGAHDPSNVHHLGLDFRGGTGSVRVLVDRVAY